MSPPSWQDSVLHAYPDARLDLHGLRAGAAEGRVEGFLEAEARLARKQKGKRGRVVHIVTGKGTGVLLEAVEALLASDLRVVEHALDLQGAGYKARVR